MKTSAYIWRNQHGTWYFRAVIPQHLRHHFPQHRREIRRSLQTDSRKLAIRQARAVRVEFDYLLDQLETPAMSDNEQDSLRTGLIVFDELSYGDVTIKGVKIDHGDAEKERESLKDIISTLPAATVTPPIPDTPIESDSPPLSRVIGEFCAEQEQGDNWKLKTADEYEYSYGLLLRIVGDKPIAGIDHAIMREFKSKLLRLPPNMRKAKRYRGNSIDEILALDNIKPMSVSTVNKQISRTSSLFGWAQRQGYIPMNPAQGLTVKQKRRADSERDILTVEEMQALFDGYVYRGAFPAQSKPYDYQCWLPPMAAFTGARIEELCMLRCEDVRQVDGIWCLDITNAKTTAGERLIPIHRRLLDLNFIEFVNDMRDQGEERLFPELPKQRDGYSQAASKWFARYRKACGVGATDGKKSFHSFRHGFIDNLKQQGDIPQEKIAAIVGHETESVTFSRYGKSYHPSVLVDVVNRASYDGLSLEHIDFDDSQGRRREQLPRF